MKETNVINLVPRPSCLSDMIYIIRTPKGPDILFELRCIYTSENFPRNGKFSLEKIVLRMRSAEIFSVPWKFSRSVYAPLANV